MGSGSSYREFLHVDDMASASIHVMNLDNEIFKSSIKPMLSHINIGTGCDCTIKQLSETISKIIGFKGNIIFDSSKPDGTPRKLLDITRINELGWTAKISLEEGLKSTYSWYQRNINQLRT